MALLEGINFSGIGGSITSFIMFGGILLILFFVGRWYLEKKKFDIDVIIDRKIGDGIQRLYTKGYQKRDDYGVTTFISKDYGIDLPAVDNKYFVVQKGGLRCIMFSNPQPTIYIPVEMDYLNYVNGKTFEKSKEDNCLYCNYIKKCEAENKIPDYKKEFKEMMDKETTLKMCSKHVSQYFQSKFKVVSEVSKEWLLVRMRERLQRAITKKAWYENQIFTQIIAAVIFLATIIIIFKFGEKWFSTAMEKAASHAADVFIAKTQNITMPPN